MSARPHRGKTRATWKWECAHASMAVVRQWRCGEGADGRDPMNGKLSLSAADCHALLLCLQQYPWHRRIGVASPLDVGMAAASGLNAIPHPLSQPQPRANLASGSRIVNSSSNGAPSFDRPSTLQAMIVRSFGLLTGAILIVWTTTFSMPTLSPQLPNPFSVYVLMYAFGLNAKVSFTRMLRRRPTDRSQDHLPRRSASSRGLPSAPHPQFQ
jgi:hypothetical protein